MARDAQAHTVFGPHGDGNGELVLTFDLSLAITVHARLVNNVAASMAGGTRGDLLKHDAAIAPAGRLLSAAVTRLTGARRGPGLGARALTLRTGLGTNKLECFFATGNDAFEGNIENGLQIRSPRWASGPAVAAKEPVEDSTAAAEVEPPEAEVAEDILEIDVPEEVLGGEPLDTSEAARIVVRSLLGIGKHRIRRRNFFKALFGVRRFVAVRMILQRQRAKGVFDGLLVRVPGNAEDVIIVALFRCHGASLYRIPNS